MMTGKRNGFTLIEVLMALAVTGIAAMGIFRLQLIGVEAARHSQLVMRAGLVGESRMERAIAEAHARSRPPEAEGGEGVFEGVNVAYRWRLEVEEAGAHFPDLAEDIRYLWHLHCRVSWGDEGREKSIELTRYVWDYDFAQ